MGILKISKEITPFSSSSVTFGRALIQEKMSKVKFHFVTFPFNMLTGARNIGYCLVS